MGSKWISQFLLIIMVVFTPFSLFAESIILKSKEEKMIDRFYSEALSPETQTEAVKRLKGMIEDEKLKAPDRQYAITKLGDLKIEGLEKYFLDLSAKSYKSEISRQLLSDLSRSHWKSKVNQEQDPEKQVSLLIEALSAQYEDLRDGFTRGWASNELCDRGIQSAFPKIVESVESRFSSKSDSEKIINLCQGKLEYLSKYPTRFEAMVGILDELDTYENHDLKYWALDNLGEIKTEAAIQIVADFGLRLQREGREINSRLGGIQDVTLHSSLHRNVLATLRGAGWSDQEIKKYEIKFTDVFSLTE